jgi:predicted nuclease with TOPRIM domain
MSEKLPRWKSKVTITEQQTREAEMEKRIAELRERIELLEQEKRLLHMSYQSDCSRLENKLAEVQSKAELWEKVKVFFSREWKPIDNTFTWIFQRRLPAKNPDTIEDAVRRWT